MQKVLIIEDDPILLRMYKDKFEAVGEFEVITAADGEVGLEEALRNQPDFIMLDLRLPKVDGIEVIKKLKVTPVIKNIPVALLTVVQEDIALKDDPDLMEKAIAYWRKDQVTPAEVLENVQKILNHG